MNIIWNVFLTTLLSVSLLSSSEVGETEARKYGQTLWRHIVTTGGYIVGYRFNVNRENGNVSEPLKYFSKHIGNSDFNGVIKIFYQANIPPEVKTEVLSELNIEAKSLDPESLTYIVYEYIEPFEILFSEKKDIAGHPQLRKDVAGVDVKCFKIGETGSTEAYLDLPI